MRIFFIIFLLAAAGINSFSERLAVLKELNKPQVMKINKKHLLINDSTVKVHLYETENFKYRQVGKQGNGPGEYPIIPEIHFTKEHIFIYRKGKCMFYNREGVYIKEFKIPSLRTSSFCPFGKNYLIVRAEFNNRQDMYTELSIVSHSKKNGLKYKKLLYYQEVEKKVSKGRKAPFKLLETFFNYKVYRDKVFVHDNNIGFYVEIYDLEGNQISKVNIPYEKKKVPSNFTDKYVELFKKHGAWEMFKNTSYFVVPEYFPAFHCFDVGNDKMYFLTYNEKDSKRELLVTDLKGKFLKRTFVPWVEEMHTYFAIENNKFYYIKENEDIEEWELHVEDIK
jgi:hypothetical protein